MLYEPYELNESNMQSYIKFKFISDDLEKTTSKKNTKATENIISKTHIFIPKENDTLFWCYYIIFFGDTKYEMLNFKNTLVEKQNKINFISKIRENKQIIKTYKFDTLTSIENNLANDNMINIKTIMALCAIDKINVIFVKKRSYYELLMNDDKPIYIIREIENQSRYSKKYGYEIANDGILEEIRSTLYKVDSLDKPVKGLSSYKVQDLINIANKLAIETVNKETGKSKIKNELYELIIQYF